jgi:hypothetical protein
VTWISSIPPVSAVSAASVAAVAASEDPAYPPNIADMAYASLWLVFNHLSQDQKLRSEKKAKAFLRLQSRPKILFQVGHPLVPFLAQPRQHPAAS